MTAKEKIEVMQAYVDGKQIECRRTIPSSLGKTDDWEDSRDPSWDWVLFDYRIKPELKFRPYKDTKEFIEDFKERFKPKDWPSYSMPLIWVVWNGWKSYVDGFNERAVCVKGYINDMDDLFRSCTYLDGSPCGKEVTE